MDNLLQSIVRDRLYWEKKDETEVSEERSYSNCVMEKNFKMKIKRTKLLQKF